MTFLLSSVFAAMTTNIAFAGPVDVQNIEKNPVHTKEKTTPPLTKQDALKQALEDSFNNKNSTEKTIPSAIKNQNKKNDNCFTIEVKPSKKGDLSIPKQTVCLSSGVGIS